MTYSWPASLATLDKAFDDFDRDGFVVFENVLDADGIAAVRDALTPYLDSPHKGRNDFEGLKTNRVYALLGKDPLFGDIAAHPLALAFVERDLGSNPLLASALAINLHPGESVQPWHTDDGHIDIPLPRPSFGVSTFWAIDETTTENGATEVIPGSHLWSEVECNAMMERFYTAPEPDPYYDPAPHPDAVALCLPAGAVAITKGNLWHRGGANRSDTTRLILTPQYGPAWARPLETMLLAVPPDMAARYPKRVQELLGYSIHPPFMGYVDGRHPAKSLPAQT